MKPSGPKEKQNEEPEEDSRRHREGNRRRSGAHRPGRQRPRFQDIPLSSLWIVDRYTESCRQRARYHETAGNEGASMTEVQIDEGQMIGHLISGLGLRGDLFLVGSTGNS